MPTKVAQFCKYLDRIECEYTVKLDEGSPGSKFWIVSSSYGRGWIQAMWYQHDHESWRRAGTKFSGFSIYMGYPHEVTKHNGYHALRHYFTYAKKREKVA